MKKILFNLVVIVMCVFTLWLMAAHLKEMDELKGDIRVLESITANITRVQNHQIEILGENDQQLSEQIRILNMKIEALK